jgi:hypothetical protein
VAQDKTRVRKSTSSIPTPLNPLTSERSSTPAHPVIDIPGSNKKPPVNPRDPRTGHFTSREKLTEEQKKDWVAAVASGEKFQKLPTQHIPTENGNLKEKFITPKTRNQVQENPNQYDALL